MPPLATHDRTTHWVIHSHGGFDRNNEVRADVVFIIDHSVAMSGVGASDLQRLDVGCVSLSRRHLEGQARSAWPATMPNAQVGVCVGSKDRGTCRHRCHLPRSRRSRAFWWWRRPSRTDPVLRPGVPAAADVDAAISKCSRVAQNSGQLLARFIERCIVATKVTWIRTGRTPAFTARALGRSIGLSDHATCRSRRAPLGPRRIARCASPVRRRRPRPAWRHDHRLTGILPGPRGGGRLRLTLGR